MKLKSAFLAAACAVGVCILNVSSVMAADGWGTDYQAALAQAKSENKKILVDFTGSDWCGWCVKLDKDTFSQPKFKEFAAQNLVLLEVDFPNNKPQTDAVKKQNAELKDQFNVEGFPTLVLLDPSGKEVARNVGYLAGGPAGLIQWVNSAK